METIGAFDGGFGFNIDQLLMSQKLYPLSHAAPWYGDSHFDVDYT